MSDPDEPYALESRPIPGWSRERRSVALTTWPAGLAAGLIATLSGLPPLELAIVWTLVAIATAVAGFYTFTNPPLVDDARAALIVSGVNLALLAIGIRLTGSAASPFVPLLLVPLIFTAIAARPAHVAFAALLAAIADLAGTWPLAPADPPLPWGAASVRLGVYAIVGFRLGRFANLLRREVDQRARLAHREAERQHGEAGRLMPIVQTARLVTRELDLDLLLQGIVEGAVAAIPGAQAGSVMVIEGNQLAYRAAVGFDLAILRRLRLDPARIGIPGRAFAPGRVYRHLGRSEAPLGPALTQEEVALLDQASGGRGILASLSAPLFVEGRLYGLLFVDAFDSDALLGAGAEQALSVYAEHCLVAIQKAEAFKALSERARLFRLVARLGALLNGGLHRDEALRIASSVIEAEMDYDLVMVGLVEGAVVRPASGQREAVAALPPVPLGLGLVGTCAAEARPLMVNDVSADPRYLPGVPWARSELVVPIMLRGRCVAVLDITSRRAGAFTDSDLESLTLVADQLAGALENARLLESELARSRELAAALAEIQRTYTATLSALGAALDTRDTATEAHSQRVGRYAIRLARELRLGDAQLRDLEQGAYLHDVGKIGLPDAVLQKPGPLSEEEWEIVRRHPQIGAALLRRIPFLQGAAEIALCHHERWDGTGYPRGLAAAAIPVAARVFAVADAFDAMTSDRAYRAARPLARAREEIAELAGAQFDPGVVEAFLRVPLAEWERIRAEVTAGLPSRSDLSAAG
jgi:putative nucleotidyltransferase with HDIG domain